MQIMNNSRNICSHFRYILEVGKGHGKGVTDGNWFGMIWREVMNKDCPMIGAVVSKTAIDCVPAFEPINRFLVCFFTFVV